MSPGHQGNESQWVAHRKFSRKWHRPWGECSSRLIRGPLWSPLGKKFEPCFSYRRRGVVSNQSQSTQVGPDAAGQQPSCRALCLYIKKASSVTGVCVCVCVCVCVHVQSCTTLGESMDRSPSGSSIHWIFEARILDWVATSSSRGSSQPRNWTCVPFTFCISRWIPYH